MLKSGRNWRRRQKQSIDDRPKLVRATKARWTQSAIGSESGENQRDANYNGLSCRTEATDESRHPDLVTSDFPKGILSLCTLWKLVCSIPQSGE